MSATVLAPARAAFADDGTPWSETFGDVYHSSAGGLEQARHVFLQGNGLPERWRGRSRFVVFETGFGLGLNFLATWQAWRRDPQRCERLHFVSIEKHPFPLQDLRTLHERFPELSDEATELHGTWPILVPGGHRAELDGGRVILTVFFADISIARDLRLAADAVYLDGFSPAKNPEMWSPQTLRSVSRLCAPGATLATWSVAGSVRDALQQTGFSVEKIPGFSHKKEMLRGRYHGNEKPESPRNRSATVVGAGLAGAFVCERLCSRGWEVTLYERHASAAEEGSGNHAGVFHPIVTPDDSFFARLTRAGALLLLQRLASLKAVRWDPCGVLQLSRTPKEDASQRASIGTLALPADYAQFVDQDEASRHAGVPVASGGLWFPSSGWVQPRSLVEGLLNACGDRLHRRFNDEMKKEDFGKNKRAVPILCTGDDALCKVPDVRLRSVRGQVTYVPEESFEPPHVVCLRGGLLLPAVEGLCVVGASFDIDDPDPLPRPENDEGNLERLRKILLSSEVRKSQPFQNRVGFRIVAPDRLPIAGRLGENVYGALAFGSRGLLWAPLAAEIIASELEGEPAPVEGKLLEAVSPARFARRAKARAAGGRPAPSAGPAARFPSRS